LRKRQEKMRLFGYVTQLQNIHRPPHGLNELQNILDTCRRHKTMTRKKVNFAILQLSQIDLYFFGT
jgi:hypothetical protein